MFLLFLFGVRVLRFVLVCLCRFWLLLCLALVGVGLVWFSNLLWCWCDLCLVCGSRALFFWLLCG